MRNACRRRGSAWGFGIGMLSLLVVVGLMLWMWGESARTTLESSRRGEKTLNSALDQARKVTESIQQRNKELFDPSNTSPSSADPAAASQPAADPAEKTATEPLRNLPRQMPSHDGGELESSK